MTPIQKIKHAILIRAYSWMEQALPDINDENIDELYNDLYYDDEGYDYIQYAKNEIRSGEVETGLPCGFSRHYEIDAVAAKMPDGSWVGWDYYYGGGKHGCPEEVEWMSDVYDLDCKEEEKLVVVRTFTKIKDQPSQKE